MGSRKIFTKEFKLTVVKQLDLRSVAEICREYEVNKGLLYRWKKEYQINPREAFQGKGKIWKDDAKIIQYERVIGRLYAEVEFLKKSLERVSQLRAEELSKRLTK